MLRPARMTLTNILVLKEDLPCVTRTLAELECIHVEPGKMLTQTEPLSEFETRTAATTLEDLRSRAAQAATNLKAKEYETADAELRIDPVGLAKQLEPELAELEKLSASPAEKVRLGHERLAVLETSSWAIAALEGAGVDTSLVFSTKYSAVEVGSVPKTVYPKLRESLAIAGHRVFYLGVFSQRSLFAAVTTADRRQELADGLDAARFERVRPSGDVFVDGRFSPDAAEEEMWSVREEVTEAGLALAKLEKEWGPKLARWRREIEVNAALLETMQRFLAGGYACLVTGWVPDDAIGALRKVLAARCPGRANVLPVSQGKFETPEDDPVEAPTKLSNPRILKPFELLVGLYGSPAYNAIDPTLFVALTFVPIFGAMFGDIGQGAVIALAGLTAWKLGKKGGGARSLGAVLMWCGASAMAFGFAYGSVFGMEELEPLWRNPTKDPEGFLFMGLVLGAAVVSIGLGINVAQRFWAREFKEGVFGEWGFTTLLFYFGAIYVFYLAYTGRGEEVTPWLIAAVIGAPLVATTFGAEVVNLIRGHETEGELAGTLFRPVELLLSSLTNTVSFVRVPAFALNHAALMGTVFLVAALLEGGGIAGKVNSTAEIIMGNIVVIALEGLIVFVQAMRLQYYEFFGKFFHSQGRRFEPMSLGAGRSSL